jgi:hypothetical protein
MRHAFGDQAKSVGQDLTSDGSVGHDGGQTSRVSEDL